MVTETGDVRRGIPADLAPHCAYCGMPCDEDLRRFNEENYCETCWIAVQWLHPWQVTCLRCDGKRLVLGPTQADGSGVRWHDCELCHGKGWLPGDIAFDYGTPEGQYAIRQVEEEAIVYQVDPVTGQGKIVRVREPS